MKRYKSTGWIILLLSAVAYFLWGCDELYRRVSEHEPAPLHAIKRGVRP